MDNETLGLIGHPGGILVDHPRLRVGVVAAVSHPDRLELELLARSPHVADTVVDPPAPRVLLPRYDEGLNLRVAWLDADGKAHWEYGSTDIGSGPAFKGTVLQTNLRLPPTFDALRIVLAWPEIGFPEAVVTLPLPSRAAVERAAASVWTAPVDTEPLPENLEEKPFPRQPLDVDTETGLVLAGPRVLHRGDDAVVVLTRLTLVGQALSMEVSSVARGRWGGAATMTAMYRPGGPRSGPRGPRERGHGASVALLEGDALSWLIATRAEASGGDDSFSGRAEYTVERPESDFLELVLGWPEAELPDVVVRLPLTA